MQEGKQRLRRIGKGSQCVGIQHGVGCVLCTHRPLDQIARPLDPEFEAALFELLGGRRDALAARLDANPRLVRARSVFGHDATLLHYLASNGVETWRQVVPANAPEMARLLVERGADPRATMRCYGDRFSVQDLLETSAHPRAAGVLEGVRAALEGR